MKYVHLTRRAHQGGKALPRQTGHQKKQQQTNEKKREKSTAASTQQKIQLRRFSLVQSKRQEGLTGIATNTYKYT